MKLKERKCPNCGSNEILEKNGTFVCMNCRTFFDDENDIKITNINITRDETEIERIRAKEKQDKNSDRWIYVCLGFVAFIFLIVFLLIKLK